MSVMFTGGFFNKVLEGSQRLHAFYNRLTQGSRSSLVVF